METLLPSPSDRVVSLRPHVPCNPEKFRCRKWYRSGLTMQVVLMEDPGRHHTETACSLCSTAKR